MELPKETISAIKEVAEKLELDFEAVKEMYIKKYFSEPFVQEDPQFKTDAERHHYATLCLKNENLSRPPAKPMTIIPIGVDVIRKKKGEQTPITSLFFLNTNGDFKRAVMIGDVSFKTKSINFFNLYKDVAVGETKDGGYIMDDRANFDQHEAVDFKPEDIIKQLGIKMTTIADAPNNLSRKKSADGYIDRLDWKCIRGIINFFSSSDFQSSERGEGGRITITDLSVKLEEPTVTQDGRIIQPGFTCWTAPALQTYPKNSECYFLGTISEGKTKDGSVQYSMQCYSIIPIIVPPSREA